MRGQTTATDRNGISATWLTKAGGRRGQYSNAVLDELESQNDQQVAGILGKVKVLKDVSGISGLMGRIKLPPRVTTDDVLTGPFLISDDRGDRR